MTQVKARRGGFYFVDPKTGKYKVDGEPYLSVTKAIGVIDKPALRWWYANQVYLAMVKDPGLGEQEAMAAPYRSSKKAMTRGTTIHSIIELYRDHGKQLNKAPEHIVPYVKAFYQWIKDNEVEVVEHERTVVSHKYRYAGTLDLLCQLNGSKEKVVIDVKTSKDGNIYPESSLQVSAYINALQEEGEEVTNGYVLALSESGTYTFAQANYQLRPFLAAKELWTWQNAKKCETIGYTKKVGEIT